ncbi:MAG: 1-deoxy-D-xylulose-5-phosphate synthase [Desulfarculus sp.]|nr:MAG: 1-deoxy-D-xylulose-5-phosphate synthase [Desulfarculus sp.]
MASINLIPRAEIMRAWRSNLEEAQRLGLVADMCRANALAAVKLAGSGHLGSSFSAMDLVVWLYFKEMNTLRVGLDSPARDIYFSSKGHDVPGLYAVLYALGVVPEESLLRLRRLQGLDGHPDVGVPGVEANSGSLGMGLSKGRGLAWAQRARGHQARVFVLTGDGEWQEGQNFEALQNAVQQGADNLVAIVDHNKVQSDKPVAQIIDLGDLEAKFKAFGWQVRRIDGHDFGQIAEALAHCRQMPGPCLIIADTIKGRGVSFMEHPWALAHGNGSYPWHAGAPDDEHFQRAHAELLEGIDRRLAAAGLEPLALKDMTPPAREAGAVSAERVAEAYGQALLALAPGHPELVVLDADLAVDCRVRAFEQAFPERFIECGIAEQDMVSMAGGLARQGFLPVVNSFACFLVSRANEQIYNNASERSKIIYACHYAGLIPAGPGKSHQSLRDISLLGAIPNMTIIQPCNTAETQQALAWAVEQAQENVALRLVIGPSPRAIALPEGYQLTPGRGAALTPGADAVLFAYGPVMLHEALLAAELLAGRGFGLKVVNTPWLSRVDPAWLAEEVQGAARLAVLEDHGPVGGLADRMLTWLDQENLLAGRRLHRLAVEGWPACGTPAEALRYHGLDGASLAERLLNAG